MTNINELATHIGRYVNLDSPIQFKIRMGADKYADTYYDICYYMAHGVYCNIVLHYGKTITSSKIDHINTHYTYEDMSYVYEREIALFNHYFQVGTGICDIQAPDYIMVSNYNIYAVTKTSAGYASRLRISIYPFMKRIIRKQTMFINLT